MADLELLRLAAKAAGYTLDADGDRTDERDNGGGPLTWNPLANDGDALRLMVSLRIPVEYGGQYVAVYAGRSVMAPQFTEWAGNDPAAATRRAIVRAAAAMAK